FDCRETDCNGGSHMPQIFNACSLGEQTEVREQRAAAAELKRQIGSASNGDREWMHFFHSQINDCNDVRR
ncbi:hypothetical protein PENTCL1PPCAC_18879, partial [Pristionchus entomophagus]